MHDKLKNWEAFEDEEAQEDSLDSEEDYLLDVTDRFLEKKDFPTNLDVQIEANDIKNKLYKLGSFLASHNLLEERKKVVKLAHDSASEEAKNLRNRFKKDILNLLSEEYYSHYTNWSYEVDFDLESINIGFSDLEKDFVQLMHDGLVALSDLNVDEALEVLWAASGLTPDGHHDFDENLISLDAYLYKDLQADDTNGDEALEARSEMARKFSEWVEYREPNFENLEDLNLEGLVDKVVKNYPNLDKVVDDIYGEWEEFLDQPSEGDRASAEDAESLSLPG